MMFSIETSVSLPDPPVTRPVARLTITPPIAVSNETVSMPDPPSIRLPLALAMTVSLLAVPITFSIDSSVSLPAPPVATPVARLTVTALPVPA